jgi:hypothetical protein
VHLLSETVRASRDLAEVLTAADGDDKAAVLDAGFIVAHRRGRGPSKVPGVGDRWLAVYGPLTLGQRAMSATNRLHNCGLSAANTPHTFGKPGTTHACNIQMSLPFR